MTSTSSPRIWCCVQAGFRISVLTVVPNVACCVSAFQSQLRCSVETRLTDRAMNASTWICCCFSLWIKSFFTWLFIATSQVKWVCPPEFGGPSQPSKVVRIVLKRGQVNGLSMLDNDGSQLSVIYHTMVNSVDHDRKAGYVTDRQWWTLHVPKCFFLMAAFRVHNFSDTFKWWTDPNKPMKHPKHFSIWLLLWPHVGRVNL